MKNRFLGPSRLAETIGRERAEAGQDAGAACFPRGGGNSRQVICLQPQSLAGQASSPHFAAEQDRADRVPRAAGVGGRAGFKGGLA